MRPAKALRLLGRGIVLLGVAMALSGHAGPAQAAAPKPFPQAPLPAVIPRILPSPVPNRCPARDVDVQMRARIEAETGVAQPELPSPFANGCYYRDWGDGQPLILLTPTRDDPLLNRTVREHELGHAFSTQHMSDADRGHFLWLMHRVGDGWNVDKTGDHQGSPEEVFADAYSMCRMRWRPDGFNWSTGYGYLPSSWLHGQVCRGMNKWRWTP